MESYEIKEDEIIVSVKNIIGLVPNTNKLLVNIDNKVVSYNISTKEYEEVDLFETLHKIVGIRMLHRFIRLYAKVINHEISSQYFGLKTLKSKTLNKIYPVKDFTFDYFPAKFPDKFINLTELVVNNKNIKYYFDDLEYYAILKKPINVKKRKLNREFTINCKLRVINPKHTKLKKNEVVDLIKITPNLKSKRLFFGSKTRALDVVTVKRGDSSLVNSYAKNFKKIIN